MIHIGLTGSIGMGKSTTAQMFRDAGVPVYDADAAVAALYVQGGAAVAPLEDAFPGVTRDGAVDREALRLRVLGDDEAMTRLNAVVHPLLGRDRAEFLRQAEASGADVLVFDIPLLFETGGERNMDAVVVVTAPSDVQRARVLAREGMTPDRLAAILARQTPDADKRARADFVIETGRGLEPARADVARVLAAVRDPGFRQVTAKPCEKRHRRVSTPRQRLLEREVHIDALPRVAEHDEPGQPLHRGIRRVAEALLVEPQAVRVLDDRSKRSRWIRAYLDQPLDRGELVDLAPEVRVRVDRNRRSDLVARAHEVLRCPLAVGRSDRPMRVEGADVGVVAVAVLLHLGERGCVACGAFLSDLEDLGLPLHPLDRLVAAPESVAGDSEVVEVLEDLGLCRQKPEHALDPHLVVARRLTLDAPRENLREPGERTRLHAEGVGGPQARRRGLRGRGREQEGGEREPCDLAHARRRSAVISVDSHGQLQV